jgi:RodZ C-terminal domain
MPESRGERIIFGICCLAIAALVALIVLEVTTDRFETHNTPAVLLPPTTDAATTADSALPLPRTVPEPTTGKATAVREAAHAARGVRLILGAIADTWVEVRSGSAEGGLLYSGTMAQGSRKLFSRTRLWVRFGAAANLTARLNGRRLLLPAGTYDALVSARGLQPLGG